MQSRSEPNSACTPPQTRIVVKFNGQDRVHITRFTIGQMIGKARIYRHITPSSAARLRRVLGAQLREVDGGAWRADLVVDDQVVDDLVVCAHCGASAQPSEMWPDPAGSVCQACWERLCAAAWWEVVPQLAAAVAAAPLSLSPTAPYAPRPWRLGPYIAGVPTIQWYRQGRRRARPAQFRGSWTLCGSLRTLAGPADEPNCSWCGGPATNPRPGGNHGEALCTECLAAWLGGVASERRGLHRQAGQGRRAHAAHPLWSCGWPRRLRESRMRPAATVYGGRGTFIALGPRRQTRFRLGPGTMRTIARRRTLLRRVRFYRSLGAKVRVSPALSDLVARTRRYA